VATVDELVDRIESLTAQVKQHEEAHEGIVEMINELNNLLAAMKGHAQLARMEPTEEKATELVEVVLTTVSRAQHLVREVTRDHVVDVRAEGDGLTVHDPAQFTILVVDDEDLIRTLLVELLIRIGYQVRSASSGAEAIAHCKDSAFDLILMDFRLGDMNGVAALRQIREFMPITRVVFLTGDPNIEEIQATVQKEGADGFITKPFDLQHIESAVDHILKIPAH
jgi:CheY-like chemotaxis protein